MKITFVTQLSAGDYILINNKSLKFIHSRHRMLTENVEKLGNLFDCLHKSDYSLLQLQHFSDFHEIQRKDHPCSKSNILQFHFHRSFHDRYNAKRFANLPLSRTWALSPTVRFRVTRDHHPRDRASVRAKERSTHAERRDASASVSGPTASLISR